MCVIATVGLPGSGKSEAAAVARENDIPVLTMGDVIREECRARGLAVTEENLGRVATDLRENGGLAAIAEVALPAIERLLAEQETVLVDGIRGIAEVERFVEEFGESFTLVNIEAPFELRLDRIRSRGRDPTAESGADLRRRDARERGYGLEKAMEVADITIENVDSLASFRREIETILQSECRNSPPDSVTGTQE